MKRIQRRYLALAPTPTHESADDERLGAYAGPNGDDISVYNLGHGSRHVMPAFYNEYYIVMPVRKSWGRGGKYDVGEMVAIIPPGILCHVLKCGRGKQLVMKYLVRIIATGEERWIAPRYLGPASLLQDLPDYH